MFRIEIFGGPNSSPAKSFFSTVPFCAQIAQIPNSPPTQAKFESPLVSSLSPPLCRTTKTKTTVALHHRTGWSTDNVGRCNQHASQTPTSTASGALHRRRLPAHRGYFTEHIVAPPPPRPLGLHQRSRPPHRSALLPL